MGSNNPDVNITRQLRMIEWLKAELAAAVGNLFKALVRKSEDAILGALAALVIGCYFLSKRLGISYAKLDEAVYQELRSPQLQGHEIETWYGDVSNLTSYWEERIK